MALTTRCESRRERSCKFHDRNLLKGMEFVPQEINETDSDTLSG